MTSRWPARGRIEGRAEVIHFDQHEQLTWTEANGAFVAAARRIAVGGSYHVVVAAGQAARFGFAQAEAGLAKGLGKAAGRPLTASPVTSALSSRAWTT